MFQKNTHYTSHIRAGQNSIRKTGFTQSVEGIKELTSECDKSQVAGISFGGQMHGLVILDKDDQVIRPAILWNDGRTTEETDYLNNEIGKETLSKYTATLHLLDLPHRRSCG